MASENDLGPPRPRGRRAALVIVGLQNDFCSDGAREIPNASSVIPLINNLRNTITWDTVVLTKIAHPADHTSFLSTALKRGEDAKLGDARTLSDGSSYTLQTKHCIAGTEGAEVHQALESSAADFGVQVGADGRRPLFSGFRDLQAALGGEAMTPLAKHLRGVNVTDMYVVGLGLEEMVVTTAMDGQSMGFSSHVVLDACLGWDAEAASKSKAVLERQGVGLLNSSVLLQQDGDRRAEAAAYIEHNKINTLFQKLTAALVYHKPDNPREFLIRELQKLQKRRGSGNELSGLSLLVDEDFTTMFGMLDPIGKGELTGRQVEQALKGLGVSMPTPLDPKSVYDEAKFKTLIQSSS